MANPPNTRDALYRQLAAKQADDIATASAAAPSQPQPVVITAVPLPAGASTEIAQASQGVTLGAIASSLANPASVGSAVSVTNFPATQPVSVASLPLPSNAAAETGGNLATIAANTSALSASIGQPVTAIVSNPPCGTPLVVQPLSSDINNINSPVQAVQSGAWNVGQSGTWNVGQTAPWSVTLGAPNTDASGGIVISPQSLVIIDDRSSLRSIHAIVIAQLQMTIAQAQAAGGGFVPYETPPF